jgi:pimeloyl-ACP methyl ester carboxylesterase
MNWARTDPWFTIRLMLHGMHPNSPLSHPALVKRIFFGASMPQQTVAQFSTGLNRYEAYLWPFSMMAHFADAGRVLGQIRNDAACKVLVLTGTEDRLMSAPIMERLGMFYRDAAAAQGDSDLAGKAAEVAFVPGAGHHLQNDVGWEVGARRLLEFYERVC